MWLQWTRKFGVGDIKIEAMSRLFDRFSRLALLIVARLRYASNQRRECAATVVCGTADLLQASVGLVYRPDAASAREEHERGFDNVNEIHFGFR
jgi:hypothetical protein